jgi:hypothetical protein
MKTIMEAEETKITNATHDVTRQKSVFTPKQSRARNTSTQLVSRLRFDLIDSGHKSLFISA